MTGPIIYVFLGCEVYIVLFIALHDWVPLGSLSNLAAVRASDTTGRLLLVTLISTLPYAIGLAGSAYYASGRLPGWLMYLLWISYAAGVYGLLRAWWIPYLLVPDPVRIARYQKRFEHTHSFLPVRNGIRPDTLHVCFHVVFLSAAIMLGIITVSGHYSL